MSSRFFIRSSTALLGLTIALALAPSLTMRAARGELPGALPNAGLSPSTPVVQFAAVLLLTIIFAIAGNFVAPRLEGRRWAIAMYCIALASSPVALMHYGNLRHVALHVIVAIGAVVFRKLEPRFSRADVVLIPVFLACYFALFDVGFGRTPAATFTRAGLLVVALRLVIGHIAKLRRPGYAFAAAPLAFLFQLQTFTPVASGALALFWLIATPFVLAFLDERRIARAAAFAIYPLVVAAYPLALLGIDSPPALDFFEDGHDLVVAHELARGERPYVDILPVHGLASDGAITLATMKSGGTSLGAILKTRRAIGALNLAALYAIAFAATGAAEAGLLAGLLAIALFPPFTIWLRSIPALFALALGIGAMRLRSRKMLLAAGALCAFAILFSVEFAVYSAAVLLLIALRWNPRVRAIGALAIGVACTLIVMLILFAIFGFAIDFVTGTLQIVRDARVFVSDHARIPDCLRTLGAIAAQIAEPMCFGFAMWFVALIASAAALASSPLRARRSDGAWLIGAWMAVAAFSFVERDHNYFLFALPPFLIAALLFVARRSRLAAIALGILLAFFSRPLAHVFDVATPLRRAGGVQSQVLYDGALVAPRTALALGTVKRFLGTNLRPNETFFDFANAATLYALFDRDYPIRYYPVPFYESERAQREVIATLERNRNIRAALIVFPDSLANIDEIPNRARAPLVWRYLEQHFEPAVDENGVVFWTRR
ncbi:MAG TPA: hypothetical protein VMU84_18745 [Thermoanaerobaculia bacterium]|nr:hypothetical protein [Thermoanaerobaculia bacterium]